MLIKSFSFQILPFTVSFEVKLVVFYVKIIGIHIKKSCILHKFTKWGVNQRPTNFCFWDLHAHFVFSTTHVQKKNILFHLNGLRLLKKFFFSKISLFRVELWYLPRKKTTISSSGPFSCFRLPYSPLLLKYKIA